MPGDAVTNARILIDPVWAVGVGWQIACFAVALTHNGTQLLSWDYQSGCHMDSISLNQFPRSEALYSQRTENDHNTSQVH